jgi:hypothetical protein
VDTPRKKILLVSDGDNAGQIRQGIVQKRDNGKLIHGTSHHQDKWELLHDTIQNQDKEDTAHHQDRGKLLQDKFKHQDIEQFHIHNMRQRKDVECYEQDTVYDHRWNMQYPQDVIHTYQMPGYDNGNNERCRKYHDKYYEYRTYHHDDLVISYPPQSDTNNSRIIRHPFAGRDQSIGKHRNQQRREQNMQTGKYRPRFKKSRQRRFHAYTRYPIERIVDHDSHDRKTNDRVMTTGILSIDNDGVNEDKIGRMITTGVYT